MLATRPVSRLSNTIASWPLSINRSTRCEPRKPAPPVIKTRIRYPFISQARFSIKRRDCVHNIALRIFIKLGVDGDGEDLERRTLGLRKISRFITEIFKTRLKVQRKRIIDLSADALFAQ